MIMNESGFLQECSCSGEFWSFPSVFVEGKRSGNQRLKLERYLADVCISYRNIKQMIVVHIMKRALEFSTC